jgi:hypothetical protein
MSYCRFGPKSDVYVYEDVSFGLRCCGCLLKPDVFGSENFNRDASALIQHLRDHIDAGHKVPEWLIGALERERDAGEWV